MSIRVRRMCAENLLVCTNSKTKQSQAKRCLSVATVTLRWAGLLTLPVRQVRPRGRPRGGAAARPLRDAGHLRGSGGIRGSPGPGCAGPVSPGPPPQAAGGLLSVREAPPPPRGWGHLRGRAGAGEPQPGPWASPASWPQVSPGSARGQPEVSAQLLPDEGRGPGGRRTGRRTRGGDVAWSRQHSR